MALYQTLPFENCSAGSTDLLYQSDLLLNDQYKPYIDHLFDTDVSTMEKTGFSYSNKDTHLRIK